MKYQEGIIRGTEFFTTSELAQKLKMNVQVITRKIQSGEIYAYKIGKDWRIPEQSVHLWLEEHANMNKNSKKPVRIDPAQTIEPVQTKRSGRSKRKFLLEYILAQFEPYKNYSETEVNRIISRYHDDYSTVREEFIAENMMNKENGFYTRCTNYRVTDK